MGVLLGNGNGTLAAASTFSLASGYGPFGLAIADFNGDGKPDVVVTSAFGRHRDLDRYGGNPVELQSRRPRWSSIQRGGSRSPSP